MPELIAILHSFVGLAAVLVGWNGYLDVEARPASQTEVAGDLLGIHSAEVFIGVFIGAVTFTGSIVAYLKLSGADQVQPADAARPATASTSARWSPSSCSPCVFVIEPEPAACWSR